LVTKKVVHHHLNSGMSNFSQWCGLRKYLTPCSIHSPSDSKIF
jgi:hypothetical protein